MSDLAGLTLDWRNVENATRFSHLRTEVQCCVSLYVWETSLLLPTFWLNTKRNEYGTPPFPTTLLDINLMFVESPQISGLLGSTFVKYLCIFSGFVFLFCRHRLWFQILVFRGSSLDFVLFQMAAHKLRKPSFRTSCVKRSKHIIVKSEQSEEKMQTALNTATTGDTSSSKNWKGRTTKVLTAITGLEAVHATNTITFAWIITLPGKWTGGQDGEMFGCFSSLQINKSLKSHSDHRLIFRPHFPSSLYSHSLSHYLTVPHTPKVTLPVQQNWRAMSEPSSRTD